MYHRLGDSSASLKDIWCLRALGRNQLPGSTRLSLTHSARERAEQGGGLYLGLEAAEWALCPVLA
jgi:hypothetical protein